MNKNVCFCDDFVATNLPKDLPPIEVKPVEDGGVMERFFKVVAEFPDEVTVLSRKDIAQYPASATYYVAPNGSDAADGSLQAPFATLTRAFAQAKGQSGVHIICRGGTYFVHDTEVLTKETQGTKEAPLWISAYPGETPVWTAAHMLAGKDFSPVSAENVGQDIISRLNTFIPDNADNVYVADLAALGFSPEQYGKLTTGGEPILYIDGQAQTLCRYPNAGEKLLKVAVDGDDILKQCKTLVSTSCRYRDHKNDTDGWRMRFTEENEFYSHLSRWKLDEDLWMHAALYQEWHRAYYPVTVKPMADSTAYTVESAENCTWGLIYHKGNNGYFLNVLEELDSEREWYLDRKTGKLYIWRKEPLADGAEVSLITTRYPLLSMEGVRYTVLDGLTFWGTLHNGVVATDCENFVVQNCVFHDTLRQGCFLDAANDCAVIFSEFYHTNACMLSVRGKNRRCDMIPDRNVVQNCKFHSPIVQTAIEMFGVMVSASHNYLKGTVIGVSGTAESIFEYNDFDGGSQITYDSGPFYCSGLTGPKGIHMRYNYFHDVKMSRYGIYIDDLACADYAYGNIFVYAEENSGHGKCINIHSGNQNVVYNNICVNASQAGIKDDINYYVKNVTYKDGSVKPHIMRQTVLGEITDTAIEWGGGLGYRWDPMSTGCVKTFREVYGGMNSRYAQRMPNTAMWIDELCRHFENRTALGEAYSCDDAVWGWEPVEGAKYPWGNQSLKEFLAAQPDDDRELYLRSPAYNAYINNVFLGCKVNIEQFTHWGVLTTEVRDNKGYSAEDARYAQALAGDVAALACAKTWCADIPTFCDIPFAKIGLTE